MGRCRDYGRFPSTSSSSGLTRGSMPRRHHLRSVKSRWPHPLHRHPCARHRGPCLAITTGTPAQADSSPARPSQMQRHGSPGLRSRSAPAPPEDDELEDAAANGKVCAPTTSSSSGLTGQSMPRSYQQEASVPTPHSRDRDKRVGMGPGSAKLLRPKMTRRGALTTLASGYRGDGADSRNPKANGRSPFSEVHRTRDSSFELADVMLSVGTLLLRLEDHA